MKYLSGPDMTIFKVGDIVAHPQWGNRLQVLAFFSVYAWVALVREDGSLAEPLSVRQDKLSPTARATIPQFQDQEMDHG